MAPSEWWSFCFILYGARKVRCLKRDIKNFFLPSSASATRKNVICSFVYFFVPLNAGSPAVLTDQDDMPFLDPAAVWAHAQVYLRGVQAPLVGGGVVGARGAAVVPQPHVVKTHRRVSILEFCGRDAFLE